jgi:hypothetical protein
MARAPANDQVTDNDQSNSEGPCRIVPEPERKQHPVMAGLVALVGVGLAIGLLAGGGTLVATRVLGLGAEATATDSTARQSMYLPRPEKTTPTEGASPAPTLSAAPEPSGPVRTTKSPETGITLQAGQTQVGPMGRIDLTGNYPTGEGAVLQVQRATGPGDSWVDFPVTATVSGGTFSTYVQTGRSGPNRFRVIDTDTDQVSNEVTVNIG